MDALLISLAAGIFVTGTAIVLARFTIASRGIEQANKRQQKSG